jgi:hypothetical protein
MSNFQALMILIARDYLSYIRSDVKLSGIDDTDSNGLHKV